MLLGKKMNEYKITNLAYDLMNKKPIDKTL